MKTFAKFTLGALTLVGMAAMASAPASAQVSFGIGIGGPAYYAPPTYSCDPYSRWYDAYHCGYSTRVYGPAYYQPRFYGERRFGGGWGDGWRDRDWDRAHDNDGWRDRDGGWDRDGDHDRGRR